MKIYILISSQNLHEIRKCQKFRVYLISTHKYQNEILSKAPLQTIIITSKAYKKKFFNKISNPITMMTID